MRIVRSPYMFGSLLVHFVLFWFCFVFFFFRDFNLTLLLTSYMVTSNFSVAESMHDLGRAQYQIRRQRQTQKQRQSRFEHVRCAMYHTNVMKRTQCDLYKFFAQRDNAIHTCGRGNSTST